MKNKLFNFVVFWNVIAIIVFLIKYDDASPSSGKCICCDKKSRAIQC